jgi:tetratricopeptide (TPR) repeat protein
VGLVARCRIIVMSAFRTISAVVSLAIAVAAQQGPAKAPPNQPPPRSDQAPAPALKTRPGSTPNAGSSSSKEAPPDLTPPPDDAKNHPDSGIALQEAEDAAGLHEGDEIGGVQEFKVWNPHKAEKDVEVGDFYFKRKNYRAALDRYREALYYKYNDAVATFRSGVCLEKMGDEEEALKAYAAYLKLLPHGPFSGEAQAGVERLKAKVETPGSAKKGPDQP